MKFTTKLAIFFSLKNYSYSKVVDEFVNAVINEGVIVGSTNFHVNISFRGKNYLFWIANRYYADLSDCVEEGGVYVYHNLRPSRKTQMRFWAWMEEYDPDIFLSDEEKFERKMKALYSKGENDGKD